MPFARRFGLVGLALLALLALAATPALAAPPAEFGFEGSGAGRTLEPRGIAVDHSSGDLYVADLGNNRVDKFSEAGEFLLAWGWGVADGASEPQTCGPQASPPSPSCGPGLSGSGPGELASPQGIAVDQTTGNVYVAEPVNSRVEKFSPSGQFILMLGGGVDQTTTADLCTAEDIDVQHDTCGAGAAGLAPGQFERLGQQPIAVDPTGDLYVADRERVQRFGPSGNLLGQTALPAAGSITDLAVDSAADLYVFSEGIPGVHKYDLSGAELGEPRPTESDSTSIAIGPSDELLVENTEAARANLSAYQANGPQLWRLTEPSLNQGGIAYSPTAQAFYVRLRDTGYHLLASPSSGTPLVVPGSEQATEIATTTATLGATINPEGGEETTYHFEYGTTTAYGETTTTTTTTTELTGAEFEDQAASATISGLQPRTTYHFRVAVTNKAGKTTAGPDQTFETLPPVSIDSTSVSDVSATTATLEAELNPHALPTVYHFEYGTTPAYGTSIPLPDQSAGSGNSDTLLTQLVQGLAPAIAYHYRVLATNSLGTVEGPDHLFTTQTASAATLLPDGRVWEQVSPVDKNGIPLEGLTLEGGDIQASASGDALAYIARGSATGTAAGNRSFLESQLLAHHTSPGWITEEVSPPHQAPAGFVLGFQSEYRLFSSDLSLAALEPAGATPLSPQATEHTPYLLSSGGEFTPLVTASNVPPETAFGGPETGPEEFPQGVQFVGASPDLGHVILTSPIALTSDFSSATSVESKPSLFEWSAGQLTLVSWIPTESDSCQGAACVIAAEAGTSSALGSVARNVRDAVSADGNRVIFSGGETNQIYMRDLTRHETLVVSASKVGSPSRGTVYQDASSDASRIYFTSQARLTSDSTAGNGGRDLYLCEVTESAAHLACHLKDLSVDPHPGQSAGVLGVIAGVGATGENVYFVANGQLAPGSVAGNCSEAESPPGDPSSLCNLYRYDAKTESLSLVAVISGRDQPAWGAPELNGVTELSARVSPSGNYLAFMSQRSLTGYDNRDIATGEPDQEVYLYDAAANGGQGELHCASCNPTGARPRGLFDPGPPSSLLVDRPNTWVGDRLAGSIPGWTKVTKGTGFYQSRYLSDSGRLFFNGYDALVPQDSNGAEDVYQFEPPGVGGCSEDRVAYSPTSGGCVDLISSGASTEESAFLDASETGDNVFLLTAARLAPSDEDAALDVYDARVGGSVATPVKPVECTGDACQPPASPPSHPTPGTALLNGPGNLVQCPRGKVKKSGKCVAKKSKKHKHHEKKGKRGRRTKHGGHK